MEKAMEQPGLFTETGEQKTGEITADAGQTEIIEEAGTESGRLSWQDILADAEYKKEFDAQVQSIIQKRLRGRQLAEERLGRLEPVLTALSRRYGDGADIAELDAQELALAILSGESRTQREERNARIQAHLAAMLEQAGLMRERYPEFDLTAAMEDERFIRLTAPHTGLSLEDAYCAMNYGRMREKAARGSLEAAANSVRAGYARPKENSGKQAASRTVSDPKTMTKEQREALKKRIYDAKAQGKKLPYGG